MDFYYYKNNTYIFKNYKPNTLCPVYSYRDIQEYKQLYLSSQKSRA